MSHGEQDGSEEMENNDNISLFCILSYPVTAKSSENFGKRRSLDLKLCGARTESGRAESGRLHL